MHTHTKKGINDLLQKDEFVEANWILKINCITVKIIYHQLVYLEYQQQYEHALLFDKMRNQIAFVFYRYINISSNYWLDRYVNTSPSTKNTVGWLKSMFVIKFWNKRTFVFNFIHSI